MCRKIRTCERLVDANTSYFVCCLKCYDKYYYNHTHQPSKFYIPNYGYLIDYLCNSNDERAADIILYTLFIFYFISSLSKMVLRFYLINYYSINSIIINEHASN